MQDVSTINAELYRGKVGVFKFSYEGSDRVWFGVTSNPYSRIVKIQGALRNNRRPVDFLPRDLLRKRGNQAVLVELVECTESEKEKVLERLRSQYAENGVLGGSYKGVLHNRHRFYCVTHPELPGMVYYGAYNDGVAYSKVINAFRHRAYRLTESVFVTQGKSLASVLMGMDRSFCNRFEVAKLESLLALGASEARIAIKQLCQTAKDAGMVVLNRGF